MFYINLRSPLLFFLFFLVFAACSHSPTSSKAPEIKVDQEKELYDKVIALHDSAMEKMSTLAQLTAKIRPFTKRADDNQPIAKEISASLNQADRQMWDWMYQFKNKKDWKGNGQYTDYLTQQLVLVNTVDTTINAAIRKAKNFIENHKN